MTALVPPVAIDGAEPCMLPVPALGHHNRALRAEFGDQRPPLAR